MPRNEAMTKLAVLAGSLLSAFAGGRRSYSGQTPNRKLIFTCWAGVP